MSVLAHETETFATPPSSRTARVIAVDRSPSARSAAAVRLRVRRQLRFLPIHGGSRTRRANADGVAVGRLAVGDHDAGGEAPAVAHRHAAAPVEGGQPSGEPPGRRVRGARTCARHRLASGCRSRGGGQAGPRRTHVRRRDAATRRRRHGRRIRWRGARRPAGRRRRRRRCTRARHRPGRVTREVGPGPRAPDLGSHRDGDRRSGRDGDGNGASCHRPRRPRADHAPGTRRLALEQGAGPHRRGG